MAIALIPVALLQQAALFSQAKTGLEGIEWWAWLGIGVGLLILLVFLVIFFSFIRL